MSGAEIPAIVTALGATAGGGAQLANATKGQPGTMLTPSGAPPAIPQTEFPTQMAQPQRFTGIQTFVPQSPQMSVPNIGDYDRNLLSILQSLGR